MVTLTACGSPADEISSAGSNGSGSTQEGAHAPTTSVSSGDADDPTGMEYTASDAKLYVSEDILVFSFTGTPVEELSQLITAPDSAFTAFFKLPQFEAQLLKNPGDTELTASFNNLAKENIYALSTPPSPDHRLRWSIAGSTLTFACIAHNYDISSLQGNETGQLEISIINNSDGQQLCNESYLLSKVPISGEIPADMAAPLTVGNTFTTGDFEWFQYASPKTEDYLLELSISGTPILQVISYNEDGQGVYVETISFQEHPDPSGAFEDENGGVKFHLENPQIQISYSTKDAGAYTKEKAFYSYLGVDGKSGYDQNNYKKYFSIPMLYPAQMGYSR